MDYSSNGELSLVQDVIQHARSIVSPRMYLNGTTVLRTLIPQIRNTGSNPV